MWVLLSFRSSVNVSMSSSMSWHETTLTSKSLQLELEALWSALHFRWLKWSYLSQRWSPSSTSSGSLATPPCSATTCATRRLLLGRHHWLRLSVACTPYRIIILCATATTPLKSGTKRWRRSFRTSPRTPLRPSQWRTHARPGQSMALLREWSLVQTC